MAPSTILPPPNLPPITATPLTPAAFRPFGSVIQRPPAPTTTTTTTTSSSTTSPVTVNQGTAQKHPKVSVITTTPPPSGTPAPLNINIFVCAPRTLTGPARNTFACTILERHPYTSQSFIPLALPPSLSAENPTASRYLVIVAPTLRDVEGCPPDLRGLRAFVCNGVQGVTYAAGTWHAPMVALGEVEVQFAVVVAENGVEGEDTQEVGIGGGGVGVVVVGVGEGEWGLWGRAKARF